MSEGTKVRAISTGWKGVVKRAGETIVRVRFSFVTASGRVRTFVSAWRVSDLEVI